MHAVGVGLRGAHSFGRGIDEGSTSFFSNDVSYMELQRFTNIIGSIIGYDTLRECYLNDGIDRLIQELEKYSSREEAETIIELMDESHDLFYKQMDELINNQDPEETQNKMKNCSNNIINRLQKIIEDKYGKTSNISLSKVLKDYSNVGNSVANLYGDMVYALDELSIIFGSETTEKIYEEGDVNALRRLISKYSSEKEADKFIDGMENNANMSYYYAVKNNRTPDVYPKNIGEVDFGEYDNNSDFYKNALLVVCPNAQNEELAGILEGASFHNSHSDLYAINNVNDELEVIISQYIPDEGKNKLVKWKTTPISRDYFLSMSEDEFKDFLAVQIVQKTKVTPEDVEGATMNTRLGLIEEARKEIDEELEPVRYENTKDLEG